MSINHHIFCAYLAAMTLLALCLENIALALTVASILALQLGTRQHRTAFLFGSILLLSAPWCPVAVGIVSMLLLIAAQFLPDAPIMVDKGQVRAMHQQAQANTSEPAAKGNMRMTSDGRVYLVTPTGSWRRVKGQAADQFKRALCAN